MKLSNNLSFSKYFFLFLFCLLGQCITLSAQTLSQNQKGEKIILYDDGSWRYFDAEDPNDAELLKQSQQLQQKKNSASKLKTKKAKKNKGKKTAKAKSPKTKNQKDKSKKGNKKYAKSPKIKKQKKIKKSQGYAKTKSDKKPKKSSKGIKSKKSTSSYNQNVDYRTVISKEIINIRDKQNRALEKERVANFATEKYNRELKIAKNRKLSKSKIKQIEARYSEAKLQLKQARNQNKVLLKQRRAYEAILRKEPNAQGKEYAKLARKYNKDYKLVQTFEIDEDVAMNEVDTRNTNKKSKNFKNNKKAKANKKRNSSEIYVSKNVNRELESKPASYEVTYPTRRLSSVRAAVSECKIAFQGKDSFSGKKRTDLAKSPFFSFTSKKMRPYFLEGDMIKCDAYLSAVSGGYKFICIEVVVASETAQKSYGSLEKQGLLSLRLVDGTTVSLYNNKTDTGSLDPIKKTVTFKAQYLIPSEHLKTLGKVDLDVARLVWSTGYEDYTIYETDFLINQLACLDK